MKQIIGRAYSFQAKRFETFRIILKQLNFRVVSEMHCTKLQLDAVCSYANCLSLLLQRQNIEFCIIFVFVGNKSNCIDS